MENNGAEGVKAYQEGRYSLVLMDLQMPVTDGLQEILERFAKGDTVLAPTDASTTTDSDPPVDLARLNELTDGDAEFAAELTGTFIASGEQVLLEFQVALSAADHAALSRAAHKLKGAGANIHAEGLRALAHALETQAASLDRQQLEERIVRLRAEFQRVVQFLTQQ